MLVRTGEELIKETNKIIKSKNYFKNYKASLKNPPHKGRKLPQKLLISTFKEIINSYPAS